ncbi:methionine aminopeptidase type I [Orbus hercynius]|uniref:Methionine aminopeptidase n=1 Tax=Orbus hercynius TaxID=593135 RepID=A0A495RHL3_9GAMM|nr:type I methionyl aminopeptidase [Orbus hercynius]RKS87017.1 methionine aminopeptidase type I [Orbus hercynius]
MTIRLKTQEEIEKMRIAGKLAADVLEMIAPYVKPGISTGELDKICYDFIINEQKAIPANIGYHGYQHTSCISINDVVCHGIPSFDKKLKEGDILNIDVTVIKDGYHGDTSQMYIAGKPTVAGQRLCDVTQQSLYEAIKIVKPGLRLREIGRTIQKYAESFGFSSVREYCGHGIGEVYHDEPQVLHYDSDDNGVILQAGMTFTIEPMINTGDWRTRTMKDGWTVKTKDRGLSAQYEHTILVTETGVEILTLRSNEDLPRIIAHK